MSIIFGVPVEREIREPVRFVARWRGFYVYRDADGWILLRSDPYP